MLFDRISHSLHPVIPFLFFAVLSAGEPVQASCTMWGDVLWSLQVPDYQVQIPCVTGSGGYAPPDSDWNNDGSIDHLDCGGWWYGFSFGAGAMYSGTPFDPETGEPEEPVNHCDDIADCIAGANLSVYLRTATASPEAPTGAGIGFLWNRDTAAIDLSTFTSGFIVEYSSDAPLQIVLDMDSTEFGHDTWYASLPTTGNQLTASPLQWNLDVADYSTSSGDWKKDGWDANHRISIRSAVQHSRGVQIRLKNGTSTPKYAHLQLYQLGTYPLPSPIHADRSGNSDGLALHTIGRHSVDIFATSPRVTLDAFSLNGIRIAQLYQGSVSGSTHVDLSGALLPSGPILLRLQDGDRVVHRFL